MRELITRAKALVKQIDKTDSELLEHVSPVQLDVAVHRLELFVDEIGRTVLPPKPEPEPESEPVEDDSEDEDAPVDEDTGSESESDEPVDEEADGEE